MKRKDFLENDLSSKKKKKNILKKIIIIVVLIIITLYSMYKLGNLIKNPSNTYIVVNGELSKTEYVTGIIAREETMVEENDSGEEMIKVIEEGERVAKGDTIFRYESGEEETIKKQITKVDEEIQKIINEDENLFSSDKKMIESQITDEIDKLYKLNNIEKMQMYKKNINEYTSKQARMLGELSPSNSYLKQLINERNSYEEELSSSSEDIKAPAAGMVSYMVDEYEEIINTEDLDNLNNEFLNSLNIKEQEGIKTSNYKAKIVNNYHCYLVFNSKSEDIYNIKLKDNLKIKLSNEEDTINSVVENIIEEEDGSRTIAIKINKHVDDLLKYRKISFDIIWLSIEGFRIPNTAILEENGYEFVYRNRNGYLDKMPVKILEKGEEYAIVSPYSKKELKDIGLSDEEISGLKTITLYDTIQLKPAK